MDRVFIVSGEKSGDLIAKNLIKKLKEKYPNIQIRGIGGESFAANDFKSLFPQENLQIMGFLEIIPQIPKILKFLHLAKKEIFAFKPQAVITIDSPGFNFRLVNSVQKARLSSNDIFLAFKNYTPKKSAVSTIKLVRTLNNLWENITHFTTHTLGNFRLFRIVVRVINFFWQHLNNRYTRFVMKFALKPLYVFAKHTPLKFVFIAIFARFFAVASLLYGAVLYFNTFRLLKWPMIFARKIYNKINHVKEAKKNIGQYHKAIELRKLNSQNIMIYNFLYVAKSFEASLPKCFKFKFITQFVKRLENFYKIFKNSQYSRAFSCKFYHIVAPSVWAYKEKRAEKVAMLYNKLFCILPFEPPYFEKYGLETIFIGYPPYFRMQEMLPQLIKEKTEKITISVTLGSRIGEIKKHIPIIQKAMSELDNYFPNQINWNIITFEAFKPLLLKYFIKSNILTNEAEKWQAIYNSNFMIAKSGTNVIECAFLGVPSIVYYKTSFLTGLLIKNWAYIKYITLINIMAKKEIFPEFVQSKTQNISKQAKKWLENSAEIENTTKEMEVELQKFYFKSESSKVIIENI